ncbi:hypothetical protein PG989_004382 [Apiospora arundinis]
MQVAGLHVLLLGEIPLRPHKRCLHEGIDVGSLRDLVELQAQSATQDCSFHRRHGRDAVPAQPRPRRERGGENLVVRSHELGVAASPRVTGPVGRPGQRHLHVALRHAPEVALLVVASEHVQDGLHRAQAVALGGEFARRVHVNDVLIEAHPVLLGGVGEPPHDAGA